MSVISPPSTNILSWMESVMNQDLCPLVACATTNELLVGRVKAAVKSIGNGFCVADQLAHVLNAVSYTHLTLPTICSV